MAFFDTDPVAVVAAPLAVAKPSVKGGDFCFGCLALVGTAACTARLAMAMTGSVAEGIAPGDRETVMGMALWVSVGLVSSEGGTVAVTGGTDGTVAVRDEMGILMGVTVAAVGAVVCAARPTEKELGSPKFTGRPISVVL